MNLKLIKTGSSHLPQTPAEVQLAQFCQQQGVAVTMEWRNGQYWWHSNLAGEKPIGIEIDLILHRHEQYFRQSSLHKEILARAIGIKGAHRPKVWDLTAGLLGDTLLFLSFGCEVLALERHPVVAFLIQSALDNATHPALSRLTFQAQDALSFLSHNQLPAEVIYYDPMFDDVNEKAQPRKEMRIFREVVGGDQDALVLKQKALELGPKRLVIKRPRLARSIGEEATLKYPGKSTRYDVYLSQNTRPFESNPLK
jgi:16S rRNA (guanine1516-N2)-methyltransferase